MKIRHAATAAVLAAILLPFPARAGWKLVWSDEFSMSGRPDPKKWGYETGFVRNEEEQYYTRDRRENARVENGMLVIEGRRESFPNPAYQEGSKDWRKSRKKAAYTSASLTTQGKASWTFGRLEIRAKVPKGKGVWPAFWTLGDDKANVGWPRCGEIDVMEYVGKDPEMIYGTVHYADPAGKHQSNGGSIKSPKPFDGFHLYAVEWQPDRIDFFFDGKKYHTFTVANADTDGENPFRKPHYIILNLALGGGWGGPISNKILPQRYLIDYVRVYQPDEKTKEKEAPETKAPPKQQTEAAPSPALVTSP